MNKKTKIITITNQKGGAAKTTTTHVMAYSLAERGYKVLAVDGDPQCNLSNAFGKVFGIENSIYDVFQQKKSVAECIEKIEENIDFLPGNVAMMGADMEFSGSAREYIFRSMIEEERGKYDYIIIDTPPTLGIINVNMLTAADSVLIPVEASVFGTQGISQLMNTIKTVRKYYNPNLEIEGVLITRYKSDWEIQKFVKQNLFELKNIRVFNSIIREGKAIQEAQYSESNPLDMPGRSVVISDYKAFFRELFDEPLGICPSCGEKLFANKNRCGCGWVKQIRDPRKKGDK